MEEDGELVDYVLTTGFGMNGITTKITRNGVLIAKSGKWGDRLNVCKSGLRNYSAEDLV